ncbi:uncharacterized protein LOC122508743 [Leptopilina heterotoma]|uniref:uncharacterized protein LOC122508743 n=1 Tax=Leptopilina heterotoma TaxID=63436 RepID=UPI001CA9660A|nr:uncharacterized protein LOC122508743 [Leptopilina heterotoma]
METKNSSTQTLPRPFIEQRDVCLQANLARPFFIRVKKAEHKIMTCRPRTITPKKKKATRRKNYKVSPVETDPNPKIEIPIMKNVGIDPMDPSNFANIVKLYRNKHLQKPIQKPTIRKIQKVKINPVCLPLILAQYHKDKQIKTQNTKNTTNTQTNDESIILDISDTEKIEIENMYCDINNNKS